MITSLLHLLRGKRAVRRLAHVLERWRALLNGVEGLLVVHHLVSRIILEAVEGDGAESLSASQITSLVEHFGL